MPKHLTKNRGLTACRSKSNKEAKLVERKVCFILEAGNLECAGVGGWGMWGSYSKADSCPTQPPTISRQELLEVKRGGRLHAETAVSSAWPLELTVGCLISIYLTVKVQLIFSSRINLFPLLWGWFFKLPQFMLWLQSGHHVPTSWAFHL